MSQSLSKLYVHLIFHTKYSKNLIRNEDMNDLYAYMGSIIKDNNSIPIMINGTEDHVHLLLVMSKNISLADLTEEIKKHSSRWIKSRGPCYNSFAWQGGYAGFSVSQSIHEKTKRYIANQKEHHKKMVFKEELTTFLKEYGVNYDENYLWKD